jgi:hypothetical protein
VHVAKREVDDPVAERSHASQERIAARFVVQFGQPRQRAGPSISLVAHLSDTLLDRP